MDTSHVAVGGAEILLLGGLGALLVLTVLMVAFVTRASERRRD